jgi:Uma2 family endonuclease
MRDILDDVNKKNITLKGGDIMTVAEIQKVQRERQQTTYPETKSPEIPPLESGDHLTREEFELRYNAMPHLKKAELIEGRVYMPSAFRISHGRSHAEIITWLGMYWVVTPGVDLIDNGTVRMDEENEPQPDALLRIASKTIGTSQESEDDYLEGAPELIVEVAASSASYDLHEKLETYRRNGVQEYLVWQIYENRLNWFVLENDKYVVLQPDAEGILRSRVFPGLQLAVDALLAGDMAKVVAMLQQGLQTEEHAAFVEHLKQE